MTEQDAPQDPMQVMQSKEQAEAGLFDTEKSAEKGEVSIDLIKQRIKLVQDIQAQGQNLPDGVTVDFDDGNPDMYYRHKDEVSVELGGNERMVVSSTVYNGKEYTGIKFENNTDLDPRDEERRTVAATAVKDIETGDVEYTMRGIGYKELLPGEITPEYSQDSAKRFDGLAQRFDQELSDRIQ